MGQNGQGSMSTDLFYNVKSAEEPLVARILNLLGSEDGSLKFISPASKCHLATLIDDARSKGVAVMRSASNLLSSDDLALPLTVIENLDPTLDFCHLGSLD